MRDRRAGGNEETNDQNSNDKVRISAHGPRGRRCDSDSRGCRSVRASTCRKSGRPTRSGCRRRRRDRQSAAAIGGGEFATGGTAETERIIVTGSNIPTAQEVGANPVLNISRDLINKSGERTAEALIKNLPIANGGGVPISNNATGFTPGATAVSLRGLGPQATLLLIDGRRVAPYPIGNNGTSSFFDLRSIPEAGIESIGVVRDGASTTYGADAVRAWSTSSYAMITRVCRRRSHMAIRSKTAKFGAACDFGIGDGNTNVTGVINYYHRNSIFNRDRGYSAVHLPEVQLTPENLSLTFDQVVAAGGTPPGLRTSWQ